MVRERGDVFVADEQMEHAVAVGENAHVRVVAWEWAWERELHAHMT